MAKGLRKAAHALRSYDTVLGSKKAKKALDDGTRSSLQAAGAAIATDVARLLQARGITGHRSIRLIDLDDLRRAGERANRYVTRRTVEVISC